MSIIKVITQNYYFEKKFVLRDEFDTGISIAMWSRFSL